MGRWMLLTYPRTCLGYLHVVKLWNISSESVMVGSVPVGSSVL